LRLSQRLNAAAFCLGVIGFTNPPINKALVAGHAKQSSARSASEILSAVRRL
jgi:hypothetical protein